MSVIATDLDGKSPGEGFADVESVSLSTDKRVHLIGIGGSGMFPLAQLLIERSIPVSGSDLRGGSISDVLTALGAKVSVGHDAKNVEGADLVVVSNAVPRDNVEWLRAKELGLPIILRADLLNLLMSGKKRVLVAGTHGKTSTTALTTCVFQGANEDVSFAIGGSIRAGGAPSHHGDSKFFIAEADEAFRSFLRLRGDCIIITNTEMDHHDVYDDLSSVYIAFIRFIELSVRDSKEPIKLILCLDDYGNKELIKLLDEKGITSSIDITTYGFSDEADIVISDLRRSDEGGSIFTVSSDDGFSEEVKIRVPGNHNVLNATASICALLWSGEDIKGGIAGAYNFVGAARRFQLLGTASGVTVIDDYGHHPTEIEATISAARQYHPEGRVIALYQPHRYSRTQHLADGLAGALCAADIAVVTDIYSAGEHAVPGVTGAIVADSIREQGGQVRYLPDRLALLEAMADLVEDGDLVLTLGAGDITDFGPQLLARLAK